MGFNYYYNFFFWQVDFKWAKFELNLNKFLIYLHEQIIWEEENSLLAQNLCVIFYMLDKMEHKGRYL